MLSGLAILAWAWWTGALAGFSLTSPIFGVLLSALFTGEPLTGTLLLSSLLVAAGIGLTSRPQD